MFREMRRSKQALSQEDCIRVLEKGTSGVLAVSGDDNYPYAVPLSYVYCDSKIYFHCAKAGHKLDAIARNSKVSFCVIDQDQIVPEKYTTYFRSAIAFGTARVLEDEAEKREALSVLSGKYTPDPDMEKGRLLEVEEQLKHVCMIEIKIEHLSGKEAIELVQRK